MYGQNHIKFVLCTVCKGKDVHNCSQLLGVRPFLRSCNFLTSRSFWNP